MNHTLLVRSKFLFHICLTAAWCLHSSADPSLFFFSLADDPSSWHFDCECASPQSLCRYYSCSVPGLKNSNHSPPPPPPPPPPHYTLARFTQAEKPWKQKLVKWGRGRPHAQDKERAWREEASDLKVSLSLFPFEWLRLLSRSITKPVRQDFWREKTLEVYREHLRRWPDPRLFIQESRGTPVRPIRCRLKTWLTSFYCHVCFFLHQCECNAWWDILLG